MVGVWNVSGCQESPWIFHMSISYQQGIQNNSCLTDLSTKRGRTEVCVRIYVMTQKSQKLQRTLLFQFPSGKQYVRTQMQAVRRHIRLLVLIGWPDCVLLTRGECSLMFRCYRHLVHSFAKVLPEKLPDCDTKKCLYTF